MHRSGTSFVGQLLSALGADFGTEADLLKEDIWNSRGYYENVNIIKLNNYLILGKHLAKMHNSTLNCETHYKVVSFVRAIANFPAFISFKPCNIHKRIPQISSKLRNTSLKFKNTIVKDVRFSLTIEAWRKYGNIEKILYCYRHPNEVAMSLNKRQHIPIRKGLQLWQLHVDQFLKQAVNLPVVMVSYQNLMLSKESAIKEMERLYHFLDLQYDQGEADAVFDLVCDLHLHHNKSNDMITSEKIKKRWDILNALHEQHVYPENLKGFDE